MYGALLFVNLVVSLFTFGYLTLGVLAKLKVWRPKFYMNTWKNLAAEPLATINVSMLMVNGAIWLSVRGPLGIHYDLTESLTVMVVLLWYVVGAAAIMAVSHNVTFGNPGHLQLGQLRIRRDRLEVYGWFAGYIVVTALLVARFVFTGVPSF